MKVALAAALVALLAKWLHIGGRQKKQLVEQVDQLVEAGINVTPAALTVDTVEATAALLAAMVEVGGTAGQQLVAEAAEQGVTLAGQHGLPSVLQPVAEAATGRLADEMKAVAAQAAREADQPGTPAAEVSSAVESALEGMGDAGETRALGAALHGSMTTARLETLKAGPIGAIYAQEMNDARTCGPCHEIDGRWLGNTDDLALVERSYPGGAVGGYVGCLGGDRCRGTVTGVWREGHGDVRPPVPMSPLEAHVASGEASAVDLGRGWSAVTELVTYHDGGQGVRKTTLNGDVRDAREQNDAEELGARLAERLGIDAPEVLRPAPDTVVMEYITDGVTGMERFGDPSKSVEAAALADTDLGRRIGLFDLAIGNVDRNGGNWITHPGGDVTVIDHGYAFMTPGGRDEMLMEMVTGPNNLFAHRLLSLPTSGGVGGSRAFSVADVEHVRQTLLEMMPQFQRLKRMRWYNDARVRLATIEQYATGDGTLW